MTIRERIGAWMLGYDAGDSLRFRRDLGYGRATPRDEDHAVNDGTLETVRLRATDLRRNNPVVAGVCERLASWTVGATGLMPQCRTPDAAWNRAAEAWWRRRGASIDSRGRASLWQLQWQAVSLRPTHGGVYLELLDDGHVRPIECERIRQPKKSADQTGYVEGVRVGADGRVLSYCVHGRDADGSFGGGTPERIVSAENVLPVIRPPWRPDQVREVPDFAPVIPALQDVHEANVYQLATFKTQSMIVGVMKKLGGVGANSLPRGTTTPTVGKRQTFTADWGQIMEAFPGEDLDLKVSPTPGAQHLPYIKLQLLLAANALGMPYEWFTLDFSTADFSRQKAIMLLVNREIRCWRTWLVERMLSPLWSWLIPRAIRSNELPPAPAVNGISTWADVEWQGPEEAWTDRQEANQADMMEWQLGITPLSVAAKRRGYDLEDALRRKAADLQLASRIEAESGLPPGSLIKAQIPGQTEPGRAEPPPPAPEEPQR